jgi:hypothetical protein
MEHDVPDATEQHPLQAPFEIAPMVQPAGAGAGDGAAGVDGPAGVEVGVGGGVAGGGGGAAAQMRAKDKTSYLQ